jgi:hypothetical protein
MDFGPKYRTDSNKIIEKKNYIFLISLFRQSLRKSLKIQVISDNSKSRNPIPLDSTTMHSPGCCSLLVLFKNHFFRNLTFFNHHNTYQRELVYLHLNRVLVQLDYSAVCCGLARQTQRIWRPVI